MSVLLNIDTATERASVCIANGENMLAIAYNEDPKQHASFIQQAIEKICKDSKTDLSSLDAVAVSNGPGSYTGLRVGLSSAKGICYALNKPLIVINTLEVMAAAVSANDSSLLCPMIDARRMEVFCAIYDHALIQIKAPAAEILTDQSFFDILEKQAILFFGSGAEKSKSVIHHPNAHFANIKHDARHLNIRSQQAFDQNRFADLAYTEPFYIKPFFDTHKH